MKGILIALSLISTVAFSQTVVFNEDFQQGIPNSWMLINDNNQVSDAVNEYTDAWISKVDPQDVNDNHQIEVDQSSFLCLEVQLEIILHYKLVSLKGKDLV